MKHDIQEYTNKIIPSFNTLNMIKRRANWIVVRHAVGSSQWVFVGYIYIIHTIQTIIPGVFSKRAQQGDKLTFKKEMHTDNNAQENSHR